MGAEKKSRSTASPGPRRKNKDTAENNVDVSTEQDEPEESINWVHDLLREASDRYQDDDGYVNVSSAGQFIKRVKPDFDVRSFGFLKLPKLIEAFPDRYEMIKYPGKGKVKIVAYRVK